MDERKFADAVSIEAEAPNQPEIRHLLAESEAYHAELYPSESLHILDVAALEAPDVSFLVARIAGVAVGCGALVRRTADEAEVKRMYVAPTARRQGVGRAILAALEVEARRTGALRLVLETGTRQPGAVALYRSMSYREVPTFAGYVDDPLSIFMAKDLGDDTRG
jgi:putative acetyltransferase